MSAPSYRQQLAREHEITRRHLAQAWRDLEMLERGELWHPLSGHEYYDLLLATLQELESRRKEIERKWYE